MVPLAGIGVIGAKIANNGFKAWRKSKQVKKATEFSEQGCEFLDDKIRMLDDAVEEGVEQTVKTSIQVESSVGKVLGKAYRSVGEVTAQIKNTELLKQLNAASKGDWVKVYEAGIQNGKKIEVHYFRNNTTGEVFDVKSKYEYWHQSSFKNFAE